MLVLCGNEAYKYAAFHADPQLTTDKKLLQTVGKI